MHSIYGWVFLFLGGKARPVLYPSHIGLGNRPQMYSILGKELNLWIEVIFIMVRLGHYFILSNVHIRLGNWPHTVCYMIGLICPLGMFCPFGCFVSRTFCLRDVWSLGRFVLRDFLSWDLFYVHQYRQLYRNNHAGCHITHNSGDTVPLYG